MMIHVSEAVAKVLLSLASTYAKTSDEKRAIRALAEAVCKPVIYPPSEGLGK